MHWWTHAHTNAEPCLWDHAGLKSVWCGSTVRATTGGCRLLRVPCRACRWGCIASCIVTGLSPAHEEEREREKEGSYTLISGHSFIKPSGTVLTLGHYGFYGWPKGYKHFLMGTKWNFDVRPMKVDVMVLVSARIKFYSRTKKVQHSSLTKFPRQKVPIWNCRLKKSTIFSIGCRAWPMWHASMPVNGWPIWRCLPSRSLIGPLCRPATSCLLRRPR